MVFSSNIFLFLFLPLFLAAYYLTPNRGRRRNWVVLIGSYVFYAWWRFDFLVLFAAVTLWNYLVGLAIARNGVRTVRSRRWLALGVTVDIGTLAYFKYANFGVASLDAVLAHAGLEPFQMTHVLLPIGISFYVFESISYIMDVYRGDTQPTRHPVDFATFVALFPHLIAGPVFRYKDLADQFINRTHTVEKFATGTVRFMQGFVKKVFIADTIAPLANHCFALHTPTMADAWLGAFAYTAQLYFDFSGYSDMAVGLGLMMGFRFIENFNQPYISQSITEFWRRWHISLSTWLRDYLYISLGGNRKGVFNTYRNKLLTMLLGGLWHGANWTFVLWGLWHGTLLCLEHSSGIKGTPARFRVHRWLLTFVCVVVGWVMFRSGSVLTAWHFYQAMFSFDGNGVSDAFGADINRLQVAILLLAYGVVALGGISQYLPPRIAQQYLARPAAAPLLLFPLFLLTLLKLCAQSYSPFLYFQF
ncbi:MAG TPA: MBOAT family protein [Steroidobacteraceae bacterium]